MKRYPPLLEWERRPFGEGEGAISEVHAARLAAVAERSAFAGRGGAGVLEHGRKHIRARGVVGVLAARGCQLEILPKIEAAGEGATVDPAAFRRRLIHMLAIAHDIRIEAGEMTQLDWQRDTLLEMLIRLFCRKLADALRQGMHQAYVACEEDLPLLRGRLNLSRQFGVLAASPQTLACRFDRLSPDTPLSQIMKAAVRHLMRMAVADDNQRTLRELMFAYADVSDVPVSRLRWDAVVLDRTNVRWRDLLALAPLLLENRHQNSNAGEVEGHALLFEMNVLFESYIAKLLRRALAGTDFRVVTQGGHRDCLYDGAVGRFRTKPDILLWRRGEPQPALIIDTKWKRIAAEIDNPKQGVSQADVYQLMAYSQLYQCARTLLLYPHHRGLDAAGVQRDYSIAARGSGNVLTVATVDVSQPVVAVQNSLAALLARAPV